MMRIVIAGESQCAIFAQTCLVADHLSQNLPNFRYERIEKPVLEWKTWLYKINQKNKWHHMTSPIVWKEMLMKGSKPYYIGGAPEFLDYCHSYYQFDSFLAFEKFEELVKNFAQFQKKVKQDNFLLSQSRTKVEVPEQPTKNNFVVTISGASDPLTMHIISGLLEMISGTKNISKIYICDNKCSKGFLEFLEQECGYIETCNPTKVVKYVEKIGVALTHTDLLIILDHVPFHPQLSIGSWLHANRKIMKSMAIVINASASRKICVLLPNLGPSCYNATILMSMANINKNNIIVATSDLGLEIAPIAADIAGVPMKNMFCPPVWGFVGINHLVDIRTTIHKYNSFEPYNRYIKVRNSTLNIGSITPETRTMEYLMYFDESLWLKVAKTNGKHIEDVARINKAVAVLNVVKIWFFDPNPNEIVNLGIMCNGSFGLTFKGAFSQPALYTGEEWTTANDFMLPKDPQMKLPYLERMAELMMTLKPNDLSEAISQSPCVCIPKFYKKKDVW